MKVALTQLINILLVHTFLTYLYYIIFWSSTILKFLNIANKSFSVGGRRQTLLVYKFFYEEKEEKFPSQKERIQLPLFRTKKICEMYYEK